MPFKKFKKTRPAYQSIIITACIGLVLVYIITHYIDSFLGFLLTILTAASSIFIGLAIAYVVNMFMHLFEKIYFPKTTNRYLIASRRPVCITLSFISIIVVLIGILIFVVPQLTAAISALHEQLPGMLDSMRRDKGVMKFMSLMPDSVYDAVLKADADELINQVTGFLSSGIIGDTSDVSNVISTISGITVTTFFSLIFSIYLLSGKEVFINQFKRLLRVYTKPSQYKWVSKLGHILNHSFHSFVIGQFIGGVIIGVLTTLGMIIFKLPYAEVTGVLLGVTSLIPVVGSYIGALGGFILIFPVSKWQAIFFVIFAIILMQIVFNIIYPKIMGRSLRLPGVWVLASVTVFGTVGGIVGMFLGVPIVATAYQLLREDLHKREAKIK